jgi:hypothetical protein
MTEETGTNSGDEPSAAAQTDKLNLRSLFQFLKENFVVISGLAVLSGLMFSTIFLSAYLWVFDWHLIWFVQSADVVTFGLIAAGVMGGSLLLLYSASHNVLSIRLPNGNLHWQLIIACAVLTMLIVAFQIYGEYASGHSHYLHIAAGWVTIFVVLMFLLTIASHFDSGSWPTIAQSIAILFSAIVGTISFGQWVALAVAESPEIAQDVVTKDQTFSGVKVVIVMSRHTVLLKDDNLLVIPTSDIIQFKGRGSVLVKSVPPTEKKVNTIPLVP